MIITNNLKYITSMYFKKIYSKHQISLDQWLKNPILYFSNRYFALTHGWYRSKLL